MQVPGPPLKFEAWMIPLGVLVALACAYGTTFVYGRWAIAVGLAGGALAVLVFAERAARRDGEDQ